MTISLPVLQRERVTVSEKSYYVREREREKER